MNSSSEIQTHLFHEISGIIPKSHSVAEEVAEVLGMSTNSVYRRMNGKILMTLDELFILCNHYNLSIDKLFQIRSNRISFDPYQLDEKEFRFEAYLEAIYNDLEKMAKADRPELIFMLNELNLLQILEFPELTAFKIFFWAKSNMHFSDYQDLTFSTSAISDQLIEISRKIVSIYQKIRSVELFTTEILNSILKQISYYFISGLFTSEKDALDVCHALLRLTEHLKLQAEYGCKFPYGEKPGNIEGNFACYYNDLVLTDNTILFSSRDFNLTYITTNDINLMKSDHPGYFRNNLQWARNIINRSALISGAGERERNRFFREITDQIQRCKLQLES